MNLETNPPIGTAATTNQDSDNHSGTLTPRLLTAKQASEYLNLPNTFFVSLGIGAVKVGRYTRYDRKAIDAFIDAESGMPMLGGHEANEADAALERFNARFN